jgi:SnoaL-like domain
MSDLEQRVRRLEDRAELEELAIRYFRSADDDDYEAMAACYATDATFKAGGFGSASGREGVVEMLRGQRVHMVKTIHTFDTMLLEFQGEDEASGVIGAHLELGLGGTTVWAAARYHDDFVRRDGLWQILNSEMRVIHAGGWDQAPSSMVEELRVRWPGIDPGPSEA